MTDRTVYLVGGGLTKLAADRSDATIRDLVAEAVMAAVTDAAVLPDSLDRAITSYESDQFARQMTLGAVLHDTVGLVPRPNLRVEAGGATGAMALHTAYAFIVSGLADSVIVYGGETNGRSVDSSTAEHLLALSADTDWETTVGGTFAGLYAIMIREHMRLYGTTEEQFAHIAVKNRRNAMANPFAHKGMKVTVADVLSSPPVAEPYKLLDCSLLSDGAAALILATAAWARKHSKNFTTRPLVAFLATGTATDTARLGDRRRPLPGLAHFHGKRLAAEQAYRMAGITDPGAQIDVAEVYDSFSGAELQAYEDLAFCSRGEGGTAAADGRFDHGGRLTVNPSGGLIGQGGAVGATGIAQAVEIMLQLRDEADGRQVDGARRGLTDTHAGVGTQCVVNIFERRDRT